MDQPQARSNRQPAGQTVPATGSVGRRVCSRGIPILLLLIPFAATQAADRAHTNSSARYIHQIDLYDIDNRKITPESTRPYSTLNTCGRCHDYQEISHGWHFNAFLSDSIDGRPSEPWIWSDPRTGTQLPLSYRDGRPSAKPDEIGLSAFEVTRKFGGRIPGGGVGEIARQDPSAESLSPRWKFTGSLEIDCMACHAQSGIYDFNVRKEQIEDENFAWAPTAALGLGDVRGKASSIKDDADPNDEATLARLPQVTYRAERFAPDGSVRMDLVRKVSNNACYNCHSQATVGADGIEDRWVHDDDVHIQSGLQCVDCHRNGIDHEMVRGFEGADHPSPASMQTLSCTGCHLGAESSVEGEPDPVAITRAGRLGAPHPEHAGLPPIHFEKLSCTACHSGPMPRDEAIGIMTSLAHGLGAKGHRTGTELPRIAGPIFAPAADGKVYPQRAVWPAFWGTLDEAGNVTPLSPEDVYQWTRRSLRVRKDMVTEMLQPKMKRSEVADAIGDERAKMDSDEWTAEETQAVEAMQSKMGREAFDEKIPRAIEAIEKELAERDEGDAGNENSAATVRAVYVANGQVYGRSEEGSIETIPSDSPTIAMQTWPIGHNVRPAGWSLGTQGCLECHSDDGKIFASTVTPIGPGKESGSPLTMAELQGVDPDQRLAWNQLFGGRAAFKYVIGGSLTVLSMMLLIGLGSVATRRT